MLDSRLGVPTPTEAMQRYNFRGKPTPPLSREGKVWQPARDRAGKRRWFLIAEPLTDLTNGYWYGKTGNLIRFGSYEAAKNKADLLNTLTNPGSAIFRLKS